MKIRQMLPMLIVLPLLLGCGPLAYYLPLEMRGPSKSGYRLEGKSMSIVYVHDSVATDSVFTVSIADGFAQELESDFFGGNTSIPFYNLPYVPGSDYRTKDTLVNLVMAVGTDVIFLLDRPVEKDNRVSQYIYVYDSMDRADTARAYVCRVPRTADLTEVGKSAAGNFTSTWTREEHYIYSYDSDKWQEAFNLVTGMEFAKAREKYIDLVRSGSADRRASAAYDIAFCSYMLKEYDLCDEWLSLADSYCSLPKTSWLRSKCNENKHLTIQYDN